MNGYLAIYTHSQMLCACINYLYMALYVTQHEKIGLMCTKYTPSHYSIYLTFSVRCTSSVNCMKLPIMFYSSCKSFTDKLCLSTKLYNFEVQKSSQILCAHKPYFLMPGHIYCLVV